LVVFDEQEVIAALFVDGGRHVAVGEHGVTGYHLALQRQDAQEDQSGLVFVGLGIDAQLLDGGCGGGDEGGQQVDAGGVARCRAAEGLAVHGHSGPAVLGAVPQPAAQGSLESGHVQATEQFAEGTLGRCPAAGEAQGVSEGGAVVAAELSDGLQAFQAGQGGDDGQRQDGGQRVPTTAAVAGIWETRQSLDQGQPLHEPNLLQENPGVDATTYPISRLSPTSTGKQPCFTPSSH
jgi:hypothetical protein